MLAPRSTHAEKLEPMVVVPAALLRVVCEMADYPADTSFRMKRLRKILAGMKSGPMSAR